jgi:signal transduction histidine kinase
MGIGLNIVERMVKRAGGDIWMESKKGKGIKVYFTLGKNKND